MTGIAVYLSLHIMMTTQNISYSSDDIIDFIRPKYQTKHGTVR